MDRDTALIATLADELPVAIWVGRVPGGELVYANRELARILGMEARDDAVRGEYSTKYSVHRRDGSPYPESEMPYERAVRERTTLVVDDLVIHRGDGTKVYLRVFVRPMFDESGAMTHVVEAFTDITREVLAEEARVEGEARLRQAQRMESIGNLAGGIAHDFNNLLATIRILASHLRATERDPARLESLEQIDQVTESAVRLTRSLLGFARRGKHLSKRLSLNEVVAQIGELARRTFDRRIEVTVEASARGGDVVGDTTQLEQVVMNLVLNARDAMPEGGRLLLRTRDAELDADAVRERPGLAPGRCVVLEVADTGPGIPAELRERVFEPYFTTKTSGTVKGTGLGLATVYGVVQSHRGFVEIADNAPRGALVRVYLPAALGADESVAREPAPRADRVTPAPRSSAGGLVLVVDDEPLVRASSLTALRSLGYDAIAAEDGEQGVSLFGEHHGALSAVVMDMVMPRLGARDAYLAMRAIDPEVPVLLTTGYALNDEAQSILELGVRAFLAKPYDVGALGSALARIARPPVGSAVTPP